jgi:hypothetical protein
MDTFVTRGGEIFLSNKFKILIATNNFMGVQISRRDYSNILYFLCLFMISIIIH